MADDNSKRKFKKKSKVSLPTEDDPDWANNPTNRPGSTKSRPATMRRTRSRPGTTKGGGRPTTAKSKKKVTIEISEHTSTPRSSQPRMSNNNSRAHSYKSSILSAGNSTPTGAPRGGLTYRDVQESMYPPPVGQKHIVMGKKKIPNIPNIVNIQPAIRRGIKHNRKIEKSRNFAGGMNEEQTREVSEADGLRLEMMNKYFADKIDEYKDMIEKCKEDARKKREKNKSEGVRKINALGPFMMSKKFYNMMEADISQVYIAYRRLSSTSSAKKMGSYDHIMYDDQIKDGLVEYKTKFVHLVCKPYQCWMNLFNIDENAAKELSEVGLLVLEHFNKVGRYKKGFPKWLIDLRGWEHSIAMQYLSKPVYVFEVIEHIKNGNYWARYHQYLREEDDDVYAKKWFDGTDYFPHKSTALYWYFHESDVDHWMTLPEYMEKKKVKSSSKSKKNILLGDDGNEIILSDDSVGNMGSDEDVVDERGKRIKHKKSRHSIEDDNIAEKLKHKRQSIDEGNDGGDERGDDEEDAVGMDDGRGLEYLDNITVTDSEPEEDVYSSSASDDSIPVNRDIYRCPEPLTMEGQVEHDEKQGESYREDDDSKNKVELFDDFAGWTAYHKSFVGFISRDLLQIDECEREIARNPSEDHWRRRHLAMGNGFDLPICQYRLISKKLNLEHEVRENLRMIAILKKNGISARAALTESKYMPEWVQYKAQTHFNKLYPQIKKQQMEYTPQKKQLLETLKLEIQIREQFNNKIRGNIQTKKEKLQNNLIKLKMLHDRQIGLINYIVTARHRVANAKLKVAYARKQVEILENDVKDLREMTPREQEFAKRNKRYYEAVSINKLCKQYHSLKRNNYDPNQKYLSTYRSKIKGLLKRVALYSLWYWNIKQRYQSHKKFEVIQTAFNICNPTKSWDVIDSTISELLLSDEKYQELNTYDPHKMRKELYLFKLKEDNKKGTQLPDEDEEKDEEEKKEIEVEKEDKIEIPQIMNEHFERAFYSKKRETDKYASISMGNQAEQQHIFNQKLNMVLEIMKKYQISDDLQRKSRPNTRHSISSAVGLKRRRISESSIPGLFPGFSNDLGGDDGGGGGNDEDTLARQLAGGQRQNADDFEDDEEYSDESESDEWTDEEEYEDEESEYSNDTESFSSQDEYYDEEQYEDGDGYEEDDPMHPRMHHVKPTVYSDEDAESIIQTDSESERSSDIKGHRREDTQYDDDYDESKQIEYMGVSGKIDIQPQKALSGMGESGYLSLGVNDRVDVDEFDTQQYINDQPIDDDDDDGHSEYTDGSYDDHTGDSEEDYETGDESGTGTDDESESYSNDDEDFDDDEIENLQDKYAGGSDYDNQQQSFSMAGGNNGYGGINRRNQQQSFSMAGGMAGGMPGGKQQSFSMAGGNQNQYGLVDPNQSSDDSYATGTGDDDDDDHDD